MQQRRAKGVLAKAFWEVFFYHENDIKVWDGVLGKRIDLAMAFFFFLFLFFLLPVLQTSKQGESYETSL